jgi:hypothetical protein
MLWRSCLEFELSSGELDLRYIQMCSGREEVPETPTLGGEASGGVLFRAISVQEFGRSRAKDELHHRFACVCICFESVLREKGTSCYSRQVFLGYVKT